MHCYCATCLSPKLRIQCWAQSCLEPWRPNELPSILHTHTLNSLPCSILLPLATSRKTKQNKLQKKQKQPRSFLELIKHPPKKNLAPWAAVNCSTPGSMDAQSWLSGGCYFQGFPEMGRETYLYIYGRLHKVQLCHPKAPPVEKCPTRCCHRERCLWLDIHLGTAMEAEVVLSAQVFVTAPCLLLSPSSHMVSVHLYTRNSINVGGRNGQTHL